MQLFRISVYFSMVKFIYHCFSPLLLFSISSPILFLTDTVGDYSDDVQKRLDYLSDSSVYEIFPDSFISEFTKASNFTDFCEMIGCDITSQTDLDKLQDDAYFDNAIQNNSEFASWQDMVETAYQRLLDKK